MAVETIEKEPAREYNKAIDKQKQNSKFEDNRTKKSNKSRKGNQNGESGKHKTLEKLK